MTAPVRVGIVGAGPWARLVHGPMLADSPDTDFVGVWARRPDAAAALAATHGVSVFARREALYDACDAVAFAVPPAIQAEMAVDAAGAGKAVLLEKPIAQDLVGAERLADAVGEASVASLVVLTFRYSGLVRAFLRDVNDKTIVGGRAHFLAGSFLGGQFATPWRLEHGPLLDLGPHVLDLLDAAAGPIVAVRAHGDPQRWIGLLIDHASGAFTEASLTGWSGAPMAAGIELHTTEGAHSVDCTSAIDATTFATIASELAHAVRTGEPHPIDVHRGLYVQRLLNDALVDLNE
jgi:predicted dehydrogenase